MKTLITLLLVLGTATLFAQSSTSTPTSGSDKPKTGFGTKTDTRNPFDSTKKKVVQKPNARSKNKSAGYIGETEKNIGHSSSSQDSVKRKRPSKVNELSGDDDPFGKDMRNSNQLGGEDDPFKKPKRKKSVKVKSEYANQEVSYAKPKNETEMVAKQGNVNIARDNILDKQNVPNAINQEDNSPQTATLELLYPNHYGKDSGLANRLDKNTRGWYKTIRLEMVGEGNVYVRKIVFELTDLTHREIEVNQQLNKNTNSLLFNTNLKKQMTNNLTLIEQLSGVVAVYTEMGERKAGSGAFKIIAYCSK
ncbi:MAG: hypothetical protein U0Y10_25850 [Spirosomataceae bacterium]